MQPAASARRASLVHCSIAVWTSVPQLRCRFSTNVVQCCLPIGGGAAATDELAAAPEVDRGVSAGREHATITSTSKHTVRCKVLGHYHSAAGPDRRDLGPVGPRVVS